jgi:hypothetical protein
LATVRAGSRTVASCDAPPGMIRLRYMSDSTESRRQGARRRAPWLLLVHRLPPKPDYLRVKVTRRLRRIGARALKNSVYVLPNTDEALEDFAWLRREIAAEGGEAMVCEASFVEGMTNADVKAMMSGTGVSRDEARQATPHKRPPKGSTWVTRRGVGVDRIACAWLIRRFIDAKAKFKFVVARGYRPAAGDVRFDMYDAEYTHEGARYSFETLLSRFELRAVASARWVRSFTTSTARTRSSAIARRAAWAMVIDGIARASVDDRIRVERGAALLDSLYEQLRRG